MAGLGEEGGTGGKEVLADLTDTIGDCGGVVEVNLFPQTWQKFTVTGFTE
jgi:hypothetical protein